MSKRKAYPVIPLSNWDTLSAYPSAQKPARPPSQNCRRAKTQSQEVNMTAEDKAKNAGKVAPVLRCGWRFLGQSHRRRARRFHGGRCRNSGGICIWPVRSTASTSGVSHTTRPSGRNRINNLTFCNDNRHMGADRIQCSTWVTTLSSTISRSPDPDNEAFRPFPSMPSTTCCFGNRRLCTCRSNVPRRCRGASRCRR